MLVSENMSLNIQYNVLNNIAKLQAEGKSKEEIKNLLKPLKNNLGKQVRNLNNQLRMARDIKAADGKYTFADIETFENEYSLFLRTYHPLITLTGDQINITTFNMLRQFYMINNIEAFKGVHPEKSFTSSYCSRNKDCSFVYGEENEYKKFILDELNAKLERNKLIESYNKSTVDITEDYIFNLIKSGNAELAVIKLCSKLEAVFVTKYNLNGDLFTMMDNWRKIYGVENDDCGYGVESEKAKLLQKLRRYRNSIAHPNESAEKLSYDEFEKIVRIVFTL